MTFDHEEVIERIASSPVVRQAAENAAALTQLWPLTTSEQLENDAKYGENLQVRLSRTVARVLTGADIALADAEFVYEGAESIPGRDQTIVDALIAANEAMDILSAYPQSNDSSLLQQAAHELGIEWGADTPQAAANVISSARAYVEGQSTINIAQRFAVVIALFNALIRMSQQYIIDEHGNDMPHPGGLPEERVHELEHRVLPSLLFINEFAEKLGVPRMYVTAAQYHGIIMATGTQNGDSDIADSAQVLAQALAPIASAEWKSHREDVLWDRAAAKRQAKEEEKRKNKEALASKFAHVEDDPNKEEVEL